MARRIQEGRTIDYTPGAAVTAGDVIVLGEMVGVADQDIEANKLGAISIEGVYEFTKKDHATTEPIAAGQPVYWDVADEKAGWDSEGGANPLLGHAIEAASSTATTVKVKLANGAAGFRFVGGQHTTVAASDTVVTGLTKVVGVVATLDSDPVDDPMLVTASIGDQAGSPAAGSVLIKTWKNTGGTDPTPAAASTFSKKVNWLAWGW